MPRYEDVLPSMASAYDLAVEARAGRGVDPWKAPVRQAFCDLLVAEGRRSLLEVGCGTGVHGRFFADAGFDVVCTDLSGAMVEHCRAQGLEAHQRDFLHLDLGRAFDAVFAMNCLLHVPRDDLPAVLASIHAVLAPGGLFFLGQYGGVRRDGVFDEDVYEPKRYFSWLVDDDLHALASAVFSVESFEAVDLGSDDAHFQSLVLRA